MKNQYFDLHNELRRFPLNAKKQKMYAFADCGSIFRTHKKKTFQYAFAVKQIAIVRLSLCFYI